MSLLDIFGGNSNVTAPAVVPSPETENRINTLVNDNTQSQGDLASKINAGTNTSMNTDQQSRQNQVMYGTEPGMSDAIQGRYQSLLNKAQTGIQSQGDQTAYQMKAQQLQQAQSVMSARQQIDTQNFQRQMDAYTQNQKARSQAIGAIFGLAGTVGGAMVGGPAGAVVGGSVGSKMGASMNDGGGSSGAASMA